MASIKRVYDNMADSDIKRSRMTPPGTYLDYAAAAILAVCRRCAVADISNPCLPHAIMSFFADMRPIQMYPAYASPATDIHYNLARPPSARAEWGAATFAESSPYVEYGSQHRDPYSGHGYPPHHYPPSYHSVGTVYGRSNSLSEPFPQRQYSTESGRLSRRASSPVDTPHSTAPAYYSGQFDYNASTIRRASMEDEDPGTPPPDIHGNAAVLDVAGGMETPEPSTTMDPSAPHKCSKYLPCLVCMNKR